MHPSITKLEQSHRKPSVSPARSGDTVRVHQLIREGNKQRTQVFEGVVIRTHRLGELTATITVRRIASNIGVEKTFLLHSPNVSRVEIIRRAKVRRNFLSYLRQRRGKSARLQEVGFDRAAVNAVAELPEADEVDEALTEFDADAAIDEEKVTDVSTEDLAKEEDKQAAADEPEQDADAADDEQLLPAEEAEAGEERAEREDDRRQG
jgi:large subunit ribosomal protein L19